MQLLITLSKIDKSFTSKDAVNEIPFKPKIVNEVSQQAMCSYPLSHLERVKPVSIFLAALATNTA